MKHDRFIGACVAAVTVASMALVGAGAVVQGDVQLELSAQAFHQVTFDPSGGKWPELVARMRAQEPMLATCVATGDCRGDAKLATWRAVVREAARRRGRGRLAYVDAEMNRLVVFRSDADNYGVADYWATVAEALDRGGDCEDIAIVKLWTLKLAGGDPHDLKLLAVARQNPREDHVVLLARADGAAFVLENTTPDLIPAEIYVGAPIYTVSLAGAEMFGVSTRIDDYMARRGWR